MQQTLDWRRLYSLPRWSLPLWTVQEPDKCVILGAESGTQQVWAWNPGRREQAQRLSAEPNGVRQIALSPGATYVCWFSQDEDGGGHWMRRLYDGSGKALPMHATLPRSRNCGVSVGMETTILGLGLQSASIVYRITDSADSLQLIYETDDRICVGSLDETEKYVSFSRRSRRDGGLAGITVIDCANGAEIARMPPQAHRQFLPIAWRPRCPNMQMLCLDGNPGGWSISLWEPFSGSVPLPVRTPLNGDLSATWYPDGEHLLLTATTSAQTSLFRYTLKDETVTPIDPGHGVVEQARVRPNGEVWMSWSAISNPNLVRSSSGRVLLGTDYAHSTIPSSQQVNVPTSYGTVHCIVTEPSSPRPHPTVFLAHGGPADHDRDAWNPKVLSFALAGYCVIQVNYRGSTGFGPEWINAALPDPGHLELQDLRFVRDHLVSTNLVDPSRVALAGSSWGGYLALLAAGTSPSSWAAFIAEAPIADYVTAFEDEVDEARSFDRLLFGGDPTEQPERYRRASPMTYIDQLLGPVLVIAGRNDPGCSIRQVRRYVTAALGAGKEITLHECNMGHGTADRNKQIRHQAISISFLDRIMRQV